MASPHADEQGRAVTAGALHTAARTGDQRCSFHQAGAVAGLQLLSWPVPPPKHPCNLRPRLGNSSVPLALGLRCAPC